MQQYVCRDFENIFYYTKSFESDGDMKNMFCSNFHFKLKRNLDGESDDEIHDIDYLLYSPHKKRILDEEEDTAPNIVAVTASITKKRPPRQPNLIRNKEWWDRCYRDFASEEFKKQVRIQHETFDMILNIVEPYVTKKETNLNQHPVSVNRQLGLTLYRLGHGASFTTLSRLFVVSISLDSVTFNKVCRVLVATLYNRYIKLPLTDEQWDAELKGFLENYKFPCVRTWDGFHVYVSSKLRSYFSFKNRCGTSNLGLKSYNRKFLYCAVGAPGSTRCKDAT